VDVAPLNADRVLVVNAGSSSLKLRVVEPDDEVTVSFDLSPDASRSGDADLEDALSEAGCIDAVGHRVVHGGQRFRSSVRIDDDVHRELRSVTDLAPQHQPLSLAAIEAVAARLPRTPAVACFDTAFHARLPPEAATYAIPADWRQRYGITRYGFHGLSHAHAARRAAELLGRAPADVRIVTCHLGAGASLAAVRGGVAVDTTMGFTPLEGLVMATRSGTVDPGAVLWLLRRAGLSADEVAGALEHGSGLKGLAGTADMREVLDAADAGDAAAGLARDVYVHRLCASVAAMAASTNGLDALVFTGGVGENAPAIRARAAGRLRFLGVEVDPDRNSAAAPDADVGASGAAVRTLVVRAREDLEIARQVRAVLSGATQPDVA
jgi:acetate kinase